LFKILVLNFFFAKKYQTQWFCKVIDKNKNFEFFSSCRIPACTMNSIKNGPSFRASICLPEPINIIVSSQNSLQKLPKLAPGLNKSDSLPRNLVGKRGLSANSFQDEIEAIKEYDSDDSNSDLVNKKVAKNLHVSKSVSRNLRPIQDLTGSIPEGVRTVFTPDVTKTPMPVFGRRPDSISSSYYKMERQQASAQPSSPLSAAQKADVEEIYALLKERVRTSFFDTKKKFHNADVSNSSSICREPMLNTFLTLARLTVRARSQGSHWVTS
jgi:hypothetical protein